MPKTQRTTDEPECSDHTLQHSGETAWSCKRPSFDCIHTGASGEIKPPKNTQVQKFLAGALAGRKPSEIMADIQYVLFFSARPVQGQKQLLRCGAFPEPADEGAEVQEVDAIWQARRGETKYSLIQGPDNSFSLKGSDGSAVTLSRQNSVDDGEMWVPQAGEGSEFHMTLRKPLAAMRWIFNHFYRVEVCKRFFEARVANQNLNPRCSTPWSVKCIDEVCRCGGRQQNDHNIRNDAVWHKHIYKHHVKVQGAAAVPLGAGGTGAAEAAEATPPPPPPPREAAAGVSGGNQAMEATSGPPYPHQVYARPTLLVTTASGMSAFTSTM